MVRPVEGLIGLHLLSDMEMDEKRERVAINRPVFIGLPAHSARLLILALLSCANRLDSAKEMVQGNVEARSSCARLMVRFESSGLFRHLPSTATGCVDY
jgi:hypothetical protein